MANKNQDVAGFDFGDIRKQGHDWAHLRATAVERAANATRDFCTFMKDLFVQEDDVFLTPEGGWPEITKESFARLDKTEEAVNVLKHMSYIENCEPARQHEIMPGVKLANYKGQQVLESVTKGDVELLKMSLELRKPLPPYVVSLVDGMIDDDRVQVVLDCRYGVVYWVGWTKQQAGTKWYRPLEEDQDYDMEFSDSEEDEEGEQIENTGIWGKAAFWDHAAWPIEDFFNMLKRKFTKMEQLPRSYWAVADAENDQDDSFTELKKIYKKHGWPETYNKQDCMREVMDLHDVKGAQATFG